MPLVSGYHLHLLAPPRVAHPNTDCCGGKPTALLWEPVSLFLFLLVLGGISLLLAFPGMYRFPLLDQHTAIKEHHSIAGYVTAN